MDEEEVDDCELQMCLCFVVEVCARFFALLKWVGKKSACGSLCCCVLLYLLYCTRAGRAPATTAPTQRGWHVLAWCPTVGRPIISH